MIKKLKDCKIRTQFIMLLLTAAVITISLCGFLWSNRWRVWEFSNRILHLSPDYTSEAFWADIYEEALKYNLPESEKDTKAVEQIKPFFNLFDDYTTIYIYGLEDGIYRTGKFAKPAHYSVFNNFFDFGYIITDPGTKEDPGVPVKFKNGSAMVQFSFYHRSGFAYIYFFLTVFIGVTLFLSVILFFINRKMKMVLSIKDEILLMSSGDLTHPVPDYGNDEIGVLSQELDQLRLTLSENILQEQESRQANQDLIAAMSHDLRTPLTILKGYLEILKLKRNQDMQGEYIDRCLQKTTDIQEMTNRMFEYALVFEETETPELVRIPIAFFQQCLIENCDFIQLAGFHPELDFLDSDSLCLGDETMVKRIFNNIFSNILKYGDKKENVNITGYVQNHYLEITLSNTIKQDFTGIESNQIGLKSVTKMMDMIHGEINVHEETDQFIVNLHFPVNSPS